MIEYDARSWVRLLVRLRGSVVPSVLTRVLLTTALGCAALYVRRRYGLSMPAFAHVLVGVALGLLLVFRTNSAYDRFWEGRKLLGMLVNRARDLARQTESYIEGGRTSASDRALIRRHIVLLYLLIGQYLRHERDLSLLATLLTKDERVALEPVAVRPCLVFTWISMTLARCAQNGWLTEQRLMVMDGNLTSFSDSWGGAERIMKTPIPFAYAHHIKAFLAAFVFSAPFAMVDAMGLLTPVASAGLAFALFGIDEIGVEIEDPFGYDPNDLPLDAVGETIRRDVAAIGALGDLRAAGQAG